MTRQVWLCLRCGWRKRCRVDDAAVVSQHYRRCANATGAIIPKRNVENGRITGGARSRA
jgi:hypothetical protein